MPFITQGKTNWRFLLIVIILAIIVGVVVFVQSRQIPIDEFKIPKIPAEKYCEKDGDCACGVNKTTRSCFYGNKDYVDTTQQCPDFCTGIGGNFQVKCISKECKQISNIQDETADWKTYRNEELEIEFKYPENFGANVWRPSFWPPAVTTVPMGEDPVEKGCPDFPVGIQGATESKVKINNIDYSFYKGVEGAAGSSYASYCYVTERGQKYYVIYFETRITNGCHKAGCNDQGCYESSCGPYCGTQYETECRDFDLVNDVEKPIEMVVSSFNFINDFCGISTNGSCATDSDCITGGCSGQVCQSKNEEPIVTTCEYRDCYNAQSYGFGCKCTDKKCQWAK